MFVMVLPFAAKAQIGFDAVTIYRQARLKNYKFLDYISEYSDLIDTTNRFGDTAFCMAAKYNDISTAKINNISPKTVNNASDPLPKKEYTK